MVVNGNNLLERYILNSSAGRFSVFREVEIILSMNTLSRDLLPSKKG